MRLIDVPEVRIIIKDIIKDFRIPKVRLGEILEDPETKSKSSNLTSLKGIRINRANRFLSGAQKHITLDQINRLAEHLGFYPASLLNIPITGTAEQQSVRISIPNVRKIIERVITSRNIPKVRLGEILGDPEEKSTSTNPVSITSTSINRANRFLSGAQKHITLDQINRLATFLRMDAPSIIGFPKAPPDPNAHRVTITSMPGGPIYLDELADTLASKKKDSEQIKSLTDTTDAVTLVKAIKSLPDEQAIELLKLFLKKNS